MGRGGLRGAMVAWLGLIALQSFASSEHDSPGRLRSALADVNGLVKRAIDPNVPAIPDRRTRSTSTPAPSSPRPVTPGSRYGSADAADRWIK